MPNPAPVVYLLHGEDEFAIAQFVSSLEVKLGESAFGGAADPATISMNLARLDGRSASLEDLHMAAGALPFLASRRLVILSQPLARLNSPALQAKFKALLDSLPQTTALVLIEHRTLPDRHWLVEWAQAAGKRAYLRCFQVQKGQGMAKWIQDQARAAGGQFSPPAADLLGELAGEDARLAYQEIQKLLAYVNYKRPVQPEDVENLTAYAGQADIFVMVDALGNRDARRAIGMLHRLLDEQDPLSIFGMIVRQFRLILLAREVLDHAGGEAEVAQALGIKTFIARKITAQARHFSLPVLETVYHRLLDLDEAIKTGLIEGDVALDTFVAAFTAGEPAA